MKKNIYVCGPTVYSNVHIGNIRPILTFDIFIRSLRHLGQEVYFIHNITDIDDKIIKRAIEENTSEKEIADKYTKHYFEVLKKLNIQMPDSIPNVVDNIDLIISFIEKLVDSNHAYVIEGNVFFDVTSIKNYGHLANRKLDEAQYEKEAGKKHPADFALWKKTTTGITFDSPWGKGRPGWHTECAAFIENELNGGSLDIHGGGIDLLFPHHENEDAQYVALNNVNIAKEWKHVGHINVQGEKMSKSIGNVMDAMETIQLYGADTLRVLFLSKNITSPLDITDEVLKNCVDLKDKYYKAFINSKILVNDSDVKMEKVEKIAGFIAIWDFNSAFVEYNLVVKEFNKNQDEYTAKNVIAASKLLGFSFINKSISNDQRSMYSEWQKLRDEKKFDQADKLRDLLIKDGLI